MNKILLDTNTYTSYLRGDETVLKALLQTDVIYMSVFVIAELYFGFKGGSKEIENKDLLRKFLRKPSVEIIEATTETADVFTNIKHTFKKSGNPIPLNDVWIAAHAVETGSVLVTYDHHFKKIPGLRLWDYLR
jgi:tRNA(fMet)-specific endonuclease VapC